jgi:Flp pilus assembly protein TadG
MEQTGAFTELGRVQPTRRLTPILGNTAGTALVEAALVLPFIIMVLCGIMSFGTWYMTAHALQQAADEGSRASLPGLTTSERSDLASDAVQSSISAATGVDRQRVTSAVSQDGRFLTVTVTYTPASRNWLSYGLLPLNIPNVTRKATIRVAGNGGS